MNKGLIPGLNPDGWREYNPQLLCAGAGGETQPVIQEFAVPNIPFGRYNLIDKSLCIVEAQLAFVGTSSIGAGAAYVVSLPFPANRWSGAGSAPVPLGVGMCYFSFLPAPNSNMPVIVTLADPFASLAGQHDSYVQTYCPYILSWGTAATAAADTESVVHRAGYTPRREDIEVNATSLPTTTVLTDDFNRADAGTLGASWTTTYGGVSIVSNKANQVTSASASCVARHDTDIGSTDHWVQATASGSLTSAQAGLCLRYDASANTFYYCSFKPTGATTRIIKVVAGVVTVIASASPSPALVTGDVLWFGVQGTHLVGKLNGKVVIEFNDASITTGTRAGVFATSPTANQVKLDDFSAGTFLSNIWPLRITSAGGTSFALRTASATTANFAWKLRGKPPQASGSHGGPLMSPTTPWDWSRSSALGPFGNIFIQAAYEPKR